LRALRTLLLSLCVLASAPAFASATLTNFSDLWWTPAEAGWGVNASQQADAMFLTFYVYGQNRQPVWYTALVVDQGPQVDGTTLFAGNLFQSTGPWFGAAYDPAAVSTTSAGTATFRARSTTSATLTYVVNGVSVAKEIERFPLRTDSLAGSYLGGTSDITSNCTVPNNNGFRSEEQGAFTVTHVGTLFELRSPACTYTGTHSQQGQVGRVAATYACGNGASGEITFFDLRVEPGGISGRYTGRGSGCDFSGNLGLARRK
jgi:hypothetical protein